MTRGLVQVVLEALVFLSSIGLGPGSSVSL